MGNQFGKFPNSTEEVTIPTRLDATDTSSGLVDDASPPGEIFTDMNFRSTGPHENDYSGSTERTRLDQIENQQSSGGSDTIVLDDENDDTIVDNESPRGGKYNLRPNPTPNLTDEYRSYSDIQITVLF